MHVTLSGPWIPIYQIGICDWHDPWPAFAKASLVALLEMKLYFALFISAKLISFTLVQAFEFIITDTVYCQWTESGERVEWDNLTNYVIEEILERDIDLLSDWHDWSDSQPAFPKISVCCAILFMQKRRRKEKKTVVLSIKASRRSSKLCELLVYLCTTDIPPCFFAVFCFF